MLSPDFLQCVNEVRYLMHSVLCALVLTGYHMNGTQSIRDSSERNANAQECLYGTLVMHQLDLQKAEGVQSTQCLQRSESSSVASIPAEVMQKGCKTWWS